MKSNDTDKLFTTLTTGVLFSPERHKAQTAVESVLARISPNLEHADFNVLETLDICAPERNNLCTVVPPTENPVIYLPPSFEDCSDSDHAERVIARGFAETIAHKKAPGRAKLEVETNKILNRWGYPTVTQEHTQAAKAGTAA